MLRSKTHSPYVGVILSRIDARNEVLEKSGAFSKSLELSQKVWSFLEKSGAFSKSLSFLKKSEHF
jgi:hypothetical protein